MKTFVPYVWKEPADLWNPQGKARFDLMVYLDDEGAADVTRVLGCPTNVGLYGAILYEFRDRDGLEDAKDRLVAEGFEEADPRDRFYYRPPAKS